MVVIVGREPEDVPDALEADEDAVARAAILGRWMRLADAVPASAATIVAAFMVDECRLCCGWGIRRRIEEKNEKTEYYMDQWTERVARK